MSSRRGLRHGPWLLTLIAALGALWLSGRGLGDRDGEPRGWEAFETVTTLRPLDAGESAVREPASREAAVLTALSEQAAALTGSLAFVDADKRPAEARAAAAELRGLAREASLVETGDELAVVLTDLASALESYGAGDQTALGQVRAASARNAELREMYGEILAGDRHQR